MAATAVAVLQTPAETAEAMMSVGAAEEAWPAVAWTEEGAAEAVMGASTEGGAAEAYVAVDRMATVAAARAHAATAATEYETGGRTHGARAVASTSMKEVGWA